MVLEDAGRNTLVLSGAAVVTVLSALGFAFKRLYDDNAKAKAAHVEAEKRRADEAIERANALQKLLNEHREGRP